MKKSIIHVTFTCIIAFFINEDLLQISRTLKMCVRICVSGGGGGIEGGGGDDGCGSSCCNQAAI